jgi:hypothetical protein
MDMEGGGLTREEPHVPPAPSEGGHVRAAASGATGPAGPARAAGGGGQGKGAGQPRLARGVLQEGGGETRPEPTGTGCGAARHGPRAGDNPGGGAARSRSGAETGLPAGRPQKAKAWIKNQGLQAISEWGSKKTLGGAVLLARYAGNRAEKEQWGNEGEYRGC